MIAPPDMLHQGKVRDTYPGRSNSLVVVASDRISVFDQVLPQEVSGKGTVLTYMTNHWLTQTPVGQVMPHHLLSTASSRLPIWAERFDGRAMLVKRLDMLKAEMIVRGYLTGSGWKDYRRTGEISGIKLPIGLQQMERLEEPIFTPSTKAERGEHDANTDFEWLVRQLDSRDLAEMVRDKAIELYVAGAAYALERGIILVDTKFEFGIDLDTGALTLGDEVLTPDSSRYVDADDYVVGQPPASMDKQIVRDYYDSIGWDKQSSPPDMPPELIARTRDTYGDIALRLTGKNPIAW